MPDPLQDIKGCEDYNQMVSTSHVTLENILQDDSVALKYHGNRRRCLQFEDGNSEELNQPLGASKKKKKASATADGNGCKRCRCLKSKCLKLYCDCFALGIYCTDPCECQGCLNRPEYADTVRETRQQIESRDPLAFAPKIVQSNTDNKENIKLTTPSSARHKRGCNCKKSTCLKKYCECYQANVGCSSGCRCEGCKNSYGKKEGGKKEDRVALEQHALSKERVSSIAQKGLASTLRSKLQLVTNMRYDVSPTTPSLQCSDQGKEAAKSRVISGNYLPSPVSHIDMILSYANWTRSSDYLRSSQSFLETNEMLGTAPRALFQLTPLSNPEPLTNGWTNVSQSQLSYGCIRQLPGGSLGWHSSPVTPSTRVGEAQHLKCPVSDSRIFNIPENEIHDLLQEASPLMRSVKVNSPTQKRVSPPQSRHYDIGSSSSGKLTNGRKFAFTSVPSFPPLSPFVDSKGSDNGNENLGNRDSK